MTKCSCGKEANITLTIDGDPTYALCIDCKEIQDRTMLLRDLAKIRTGENLEKIRG